MQGVFTVDFEKGLTLTEVGEGVSVEDIKAATKCNFKVRVHSNSKVMSILTQEWYQYLCFITTVGFRQSDTNETS